MDTSCRHDLDAWFATFAPDGTYSDPATAQPLSGQALKDYFSEFGAGFPDWTCKAVTVHAISEDLAVWRWIMHATHTGSLRGLPPTGRSLSWPGCEFIEVRQGLVQRVEGYFDRLGMLEQLGLMSLTPAGAASSHDGPSSSGSSPRGGRPAILSPLNRIMFRALSIIYGLTSGVAEKFSLSIIMGWR